MRLREKRWKVFAVSCIRNGLDAVKLCMDSNEVDVGKVGAASQQLAFREPGFGKTPAHCGRVEEDRRFGADELSVEKVRSRKEEWSEWDERHRR